MKFFRNVDGQGAIVASPHYQRWIPDCRQSFSHIRRRSEQIAKAVEPGVELAGFGQLSMKSLDEVARTAFDIIEGLTAQQLKDRPSAQNGVPDNRREDAPSDIVESDRAR